MPQCPVDPLRTFQTCNDFSRGNCGALSCRRCPGQPETKEVDDKVVWQRLKGKEMPALEEVVAKVEGPQPYVNHEEVHDNLVKYLKDEIVLSHECEYHIIAGWVQAAALTRHFDQSTFLVFYAPMGHGKTHCLETLWHVTLNSIPAQRVTRSALPRILDGRDAPLLLDEVEFYTRRMYGREEGLWAVLNAMHRRGSASIICEEKTVIDDKGNKTKEQVPVARKCFGFVAMASRRDIFDATGDRCVEFVLPMARSPNRKINAEEASKLRCQLAQFAVNFETGKEKFSSVPEVLRTIQPPRLEDIFEPLYVATPEKYHPLITEKLMMELDTRSERLRDSLEHEILAIIRNIVLDKDGNWIDENRLLLSTADEKYRVVPAQIIHDQINESRPSDKTLSLRTIGSILHKLGVNTVRVLDTQKRRMRGFICDKMLFSRLFENYIVVEPKKIDLGQIGTDTSQASLFPPSFRDVIAPDTYLSTSVHTGKKAGKPADTRGL